LINEDIDNNLATTDPHTIFLYRIQRRRHYLSEFNKIAHITVLDEERQGIWEHSIRIPCYQKKIKAKVDLYKSGEALKNLHLSVHACV